MKSSFLAHGKVIIIGEHSVVYGYDALAMPIKALHIKTTVEDYNQMWMDTASYSGPFFDAPNEYDGLKYVVKTILEKTTHKSPLKITYTGEIPIERGFGSSATVALGTTQAMNQFFDLNMSKQEIMNITNQAEMINHGKASGLDAATVNSDYLVFFNKKMGPKTLKEQLGATLLIMDTGELGNTKEAVTQVRKILNESDTAKKNMERLGELADITKTAWINHDPQTVGNVFNEAQEILHSFNISTDKIDQLQNIALSNHALGFKLSGGGLGGITITLCQDKAIAQNIAEKCQNLISNYWIEEI